MTVPIEGVPWGYTNANQGSSLTTLTYGKYTGQTWEKTEYLARLTKMRSATVTTPRDRNGWREPLPHSANLWRWATGQPGLRYYGHPTYWSFTQYSAAMFPLVRDDLLLRSDVSAQAEELVLAVKRRAMSKLNNRHMDAGVALAESRRTIGHLAETSSRLLRFILAMKKGKFKRAAQIIGNDRKSVSKGLARNWLEYQYGWMPLLRDVHDAYGVAKDGLDADPYVKGRSKQSTTITIPVPYFGSAPYNATYNEGVVRYADATVKIEAQCSLHAHIDYAVIGYLKQLGLANPASIAWELVPFSFVVDWFLPVGEFLEAVAAPLGLSWKGGSVTTAASVNYVGECLGGVNQYLLAKPHNTATTTWDSLSYARAPLTDFPSPALGFRSRFNSTKLLSAAALWRTIR